MLSPIHSPLPACTSQRVLAVCEESMSKYVQSKVSDLLDVRSLLHLDKGIQDCLQRTNGAVDLGGYWRRRWSYSVCRLLGQRCMELGQGE